MHVTLVALAGIVLLAMVVFWKLSQGPISIPQLAPLITEQIEKRFPEFNVNLTDTVVTWQGWERNIDFRAVGVTIFDQHGRRLASVPQVSVALSGKALMQGHVALSSLALYEPEVDLLRHGDGTLAFEFGGGQTISTGDGNTFSLEKLLSVQPDPERPLSFLQSIEIIDGNFDFEDKASDLRVMAPKSSLYLERIGENLVFDTNLNVSIGEDLNSLKIEASYDLVTKLIEGQIKATHLNLTDIAVLLPDVEYLQYLRTPLQGTIRFVAEDKGNVRKADLSLEGGAGALTLPEPLSQKLNLAGYKVDLSFDGMTQKAVVRDFTVKLADDSYLNLPPPLSHQMPMKSLSMAGTYVLGNDNLIIQSLEAAVGDGPVATVKGNIAGGLSDAPLKLDIFGEVRNVETNKLRRYWPEGVGLDARKWVVNQLSDGIVHRADISINLETDNSGEIQINKLGGAMEMSGVTVDYLPPLPPVRNTNGYAVYDAQSFRIIGTSGHVGDVQLTRGQIDITGLDLYDQTMMVDVSLKGPLKDKLQFIDGEPLGFTSALGLDPAQTSGQAETDLRLKFLLLDDLKLDDVEVQAKAKGIDVGIKDVVFGQDVSKGNLSLSVDKKGMDVTGDIVLGTMAADLQWRENFNQAASYRSRFHLAGQVNDEQRVNELKLDVPPFTREIMTGPMAVEATAVRTWSGKGSLEVFADLKETFLDLPLLRWKKGKGASGSSYAKVTFDDQRMIGLPYFSLKSDGLEAAGSLTMSADGESLQQLNIARFKAGRTDIGGGTILFSDQLGWEVDIHGDGLDLTEFLAGAKVDAAQGPKAKVKKQKQIPKGTFSGRFEKVWMDSDHALTEVVGAATSDGEILSHVAMTGAVASGTPFSIMMEPDGTNRLVNMQTSDAGGLLRALDLFDDIRGGELEISGAMNDQEPNRPFVGVLRVNEYRITKVPALAKLLNLAGLTGILDVLVGQGIGMSNLVAPFKYENDILEIKDGRTNGVSIGLTWEGRVNAKDRVADLRGTVVPVYALNSVLGNIPILGDLFSGGQKGSGLFAWTYEVKGNLDDPEVKINPVSALAPGVLRRIFQPPEGQGSSKDKKQDEKKPQDQ